MSKFHGTVEEGHWSGTRGGNSGGALEGANVLPCSGQTEMLKLAAEVNLESHGSSQQKSKTGKAIPKLRPNSQSAGLKALSSKGAQRRGSVGANYHGAGPGQRDSL